MKKIIFSFLLLFLLCGCTSREDFFIFKFDDYSISVGSDSVKDLSKVFVFKDLPENLQAKQTLEDVKCYIDEKHIATVDITNTKNRDRNINDCIITRLQYFLQDGDFETYYIDDVLLDSSIKIINDRFGGEYIIRNGIASVFNKTVGNYNDVVVLHGDIFALNQDELNHLDIYVETIEKK